MITKGEAFLLLRKLHSANVDVVCISSLFDWGVVFFGKISALDGEKLVITASDKRSAVTLRLGEGLKFEYAEPSALPPAQLALVPASALHAAMVGVALPLRVPPSAFNDPSFVPRREKLFIVEVTEGMLK